MADLKIRKNDCKIAINSMVMDPFFHGFETQFQTFNRYKPNPISISVYVMLVFASAFFILIKKEIKDQSFYEIIKLKFLLNCFMKKSNKTKGEWFVHFFDKKYPHSPFHQQLIFFSVSLLQLI